MPLGRLLSSMQTLLVCLLFHNLDERQVVLTLIAMRGRCQTVLAHIVQGRAILSSIDTASDGQRR